MIGKAAPRTNSGEFNGLAKLRPPAAFWAAAFALAVTMAFSAAPTPLYVLYQHRWGFSTFTITVVYALYAAGVIVGLLFGGHVSDWYGRRPVLITALLTNLVSAAGFLLSPPLAGLLAARLVCGIAIGLTTATATAYITELDALVAPPPEGTGTRAATVAIVANVGGIGLGPLVSGCLAQYAPQPLRLPYLAFALLLATATALIALSPETVRVPDPRPSYRPQRIAVPARARPVFLSAAGLGFAAFSVYGVIASLTPPF